MKEIGNVINAGQIFEKARFEAETSRALKEMGYEMQKEFAIMNLIEYEIMKAEEEEAAIKAGYEEGMWDK